MDTFPAFIPLAGRTVVVAGEGEAAEAKARLFDGSPARLVRVDGEAALDAGAYEGAALAFIAGPEPFAIAAAKAARSAGVLVNVVDRPALSDFQTPSIVDRGAVVGAIGTGGAAPVLASQLRGDLEASWAQGLGGVADLLRQLQPEIRARYPDLLARRVVLRRLIDGPAAQCALTGDMAAAVDLGRTALATAEVPKGRLLIVSAPETIDQLRLGDLRALGRADRIVARLTSPDAVVVDLLSMTRRDAARTDSVDSSDAQLAAWVAAGEVVVRIIAKGEAASDLDTPPPLGAP